VQLFFQARAKDGDYCLFCEPSPPRGSAWRGRRAAGCWLTAAVAALVALASYLATARERYKEPTVAENRTSCVSGNVCQAAWVQRTSHHLGVPQPSTGSCVLQATYSINNIEIALSSGALPGCINSVGIPALYKPRKDVRRRSPPSHHNQCK
jgi:hypothetical protein